MSNPTLSSSAPAKFQPPARADVSPDGSAATDARSGKDAFPVTRIERKKQGKVIAIFKAAEELFLAQGYHATPIDQIAKQAGVSVGSVYVYFKSKEKLCLALLDKALETQERYLIEAIDPAEDPETTLRHLGRAYMRFFLDHPRTFKLLMFLEHGGLDRGRPGGAAAMDSYDRRTERLLQVLSSQIIEGIHRGQFREMDPARAARFLWGSFTGVIGLTGRTGPTRVRIEDLPRTLELGSDLVLGGLLRCPDRGD